MIDLKLLGADGSSFDLTLDRWRTICVILSRAGFNPPRAWLHPEAIVRADEDICARMAAAMRRALREPNGPAAAMAPLAEEPRDRTARSGAAGVWTSPAPGALDGPLRFGPGAQRAEEAPQASLCAFAAFAEECGGFRGSFAPPGGLPASRPQRGAVPDALYQAKMFP
ncbi:MAG: hypothetical protein AAGM38_07680 [Pseudomonadota bacterium]